MHAGAQHFVAYVARCLPLRERVCELGSRDVNGSVRGLFPGASYVGVDLEPGPGVDVIGDPATWRPEPAQGFDTVVSTETLEHTPHAKAICATAYALLEERGVFILTAAAVGRAPHSAIDGGALRHGEFYRNIDVRLLRQWLRSFHFVMVDVGNAGDVYAMAVK